MSRYAAGHSGYLLDRSRQGIEIAAVRYAMTKSPRIPRTSVNETTSGWTNDYD